MSKKFSWRIASGTLAVAVILAGCSPEETTGTNTPPSSPGGDANNPPVISGQPSTSLSVGSAWSFQPNASDPDGDSLTFSASGLPAWASIDSRTGRISGTPGESDAGVTSNIVVRVSDGELTASLAPFQLTITRDSSSPPPATANGAATLQWTPPTEYTDGSNLPADRLAGYGIYHGTSPQQLAKVDELPSPDATIYTFEGLGQGTHYFAVTAITVEGVESSLSNIGSKTIL